MVNKDVVQLEMLLDRYGLVQLLKALASISEEKAQHVMETWQDTGLCRVWRRFAPILDHAAHRVATIGDRVRK